MPLPLLVPIALGALGLFGAGKAVKAAVDSNEADDIGKSAERIASEADKNLEENKQSCNDKLARYGEKKLQACQTNIQQFVDLFGQLNNVEIAESPELSNLRIGKFSEVALSELKHSCSFASDFAGGAAAGAVGGALTAFGAYGGTMMLASAGTGTAISALSGVAATNATMAWLGGGTLAAGGLGVAGGTMVLGALVAGPALLIFGSVLGASASKKLDQARANLEKARTYEEEVEGVISKLQMIQEVTDLASNTLSNLRGRLRRANGKLEEVIEQFGTDFSAYSQKAKNKVFVAVKYAQLVKALIDTPILNEDGSLVEDASAKFSDFQSALQPATAG